MDCSMPGFTVFPAFPQIHVHDVGNAIQPSHPLSPHSPLALSLSQHQGGSWLWEFPVSWLFAWGSQSIGASALVSVNIQGWFPLGLTGFIYLLAVQGTFKSLLQHHNSKASILQWSTFFMVQLSHPYMTTGKTIALTICTFVGKVISLLFRF